MTLTKMNAKAIASLSDRLVSVQREISAAVQDQDAEKVLLLRGCLRDIVDGLVAQGHLHAPDIKCAHEALKQKGEFR